MVTFPLHKLVAGTKFTGSPHDQLLQSVEILNAHKKKKTKAKGKATL